MCVSYCFFARRNKNCPDDVSQQRRRLRNQKHVKFPFPLAGSDPSFHCICSSLCPSRLPSDLPLEYGQAGSGLDDRRDPRSRCLGGAGSLCAIVPNAQTGRRESRVGGSLLGGVLGTAVAPGKGSNSPRRALLHCRGTRGKLGGLLQCREGDSILAKIKKDLTPARARAETCSLNPLC